MKQLKRSIIVQAPLEDVWKTLINPSLWWGGVSLEAKNGGLFEERWGNSVTRGVITTFEPPKKLELSWRDEDWPGKTSVCFLLVDEEGRTKVTLEHSGWDIFPETVARQLIPAHEEGWKSHLQDLKDAVES